MGQAVLRSSNIADVPRDGTAVGNEEQERAILGH